MQPISKTYAADTTGVQTPFALDWRIVPFSASYLVVFDSGASGSITVDTTLDNVNDPNVTPVWIASSAITTTTLGSLSSPAQFIRVNVSSLAGGTLTFKLLQGEYT